MLTNVMELDVSNYANMLDFNIQTGKNLLVLGLAGTGKTEMAIQSTTRMDFPHNVIKKPLNSGDT